MDTRKIIHSFFNNRIATLATMHEKERVMSPSLEEELGIKVEVPSNFNTDLFGTFILDIARKGNQLEAARYKAEEAMRITGRTISISSEGTFGPHPIVPFIPFNREIVLLIDKENGLEVMGEAVTTETNYNQKEIKTLEEAYEFCNTVSFPEHSVVIKLTQDAMDEDNIIKGISTKEHLIEAVNFMLKKSNQGTIAIETDMRAMHNPTRMKNIKAATENLIKNIYNVCSDCSFPGMELVERKKGLPCSWCNYPTDLVLSEIYRCQKCQTTKEVTHPNKKEKADPSQCHLCNP